MRRELLEGNELEEPAGRPEPYNIRPITPPWNISQFVSRLKSIPYPRSSPPILEAPKYLPDTWKKSKVFLAVESMSRHMTDEGWQLALGLREGGYLLSGNGIRTEKGSTVLFNGVDVPLVLSLLDPDTVVMQDKREWDRSLRGCKDTTAHFENVNTLNTRENVFRMTVLKDSHQNPPYHRESAEEIGAHGWIIYYHPTIVTHLATYLRPQHLVRTFHTLDPFFLGQEFFDAENPCWKIHNRKRVLLSGAISTAYPLRERLANDCRRGRLPGWTLMSHPGYHANGSHTPEYRRELSRYRVSVCTSSVYGYALRKVIESTAAGCIVLTDLPVDDRLPWIDGNLVRISPTVGVREISRLATELANAWDPERQKEWARRATHRYSYTVEGPLLSQRIEALKASYRR